MQYLVTGHAGFIGFHLSKRLLTQGHAVVGIDVVNDYYDPCLKEARLEHLAEVAAASGTPYVSIRDDLAHPEAVDACFREHSFDRVVHLAAQAGIRYSLENPRAYVDSNLVAFTNLLEACRFQQVDHFLYASTSSVYGANPDMPFAEHHAADHPLQFYAATKRANELMAHSYSHLFQLPTTGLRFFTVYGPWGRPDMALFRFTERILQGRPLPVFNHGNHSRDFTFIDDVIEGILIASDAIPTPQPPEALTRPDQSTAPFQVFNIGNGAPTRLKAYIEALEQALGRTAQLELLPPQPGDAPDTYADSSKLGALGYAPQTSVKEGVQQFVEWYQTVYEPLQASTKQVAQAA